MSDQGSLLRHACATALLLAASGGWLLLPGAAQAGTLYVTAGGCTLADAVTAANADLAAGSCPAGSGPDLIVLPAYSTQTLSFELPIRSSIVIAGNGSTIERSTSSPVIHRLFSIDADARLQLGDLMLRGGWASTASPGGPRGGAIYSLGSVETRRVLITGNRAIYGGGIYHAGNSMELIDSTLSGNRAERLPDNTGGEGGGVYLGGSTTTVPSQDTPGRAPNFFKRVTVLGNEAALGGGVRIDAINGFVDSEGSLFSGNTDAGTGRSANIAPGDALFRSGSGTVYGDRNSSGAPSSVSIDGTVPFNALATFIDPMLRDNGGYLPTHAIVVGGEAQGLYSCGFGTPDYAPVLDIDQRGRIRPGGRRCDAGAMEATSIDADISLASSALQLSGTVGQAMEVTLTLGNKGPGYAFGSQFKAQLPPEIEVISGEPVAPAIGRCAVTGVELNCRVLAFTNLLPGDSASFKLRLKGKQAGNPTVRFHGFSDATDSPRKIGGEVDPDDNSVVLPVALTAAPDSTPDAFSFVDRSDVAPDSVQISNEIRITGINEAATLAVTGGEYSLGCAAASYTTVATTVRDGQRICVRHRASVNFQASVSTTLAVGGVSDTFTTTTRAADRTPDEFSFSAVNNVELSSEQTSAPATITGIDNDTPISISNGLYALGCSDNYTSASGTISPGQTVCVRHTSAATPDATVISLLSVGSLSRGFRSSTRSLDITPDSFRFSDEIGTPLSSLRSATVTITGLRDPSPVSVSGGMVGINGGPCTGQGGTISNGQTLTACHVSASAYFASSATTVTVGANGVLVGVSDTFNSRTIGEPIAAFSPSLLSFGSQRVGTASAPQTLSLQNLGASALVITRLAVSNDAFAITSNDCGSSLEVGAQCTLKLTFKPSTTGPRSGEVRLTPELGRDTVVALSGEGIAPAISIDPGSLSFADQRVGSTSSEQIVTVHNSGSDALSLSTIAVTGAGYSRSGGSCSTTVPTGASCTIGLRFAPTSRGAASGSLQIASDAGDATVALSGTGVAPAIEISPASIAFGNQRVGSTSSVRSLVVRNPGNAVLAVASISVDGAGFARDGGSCGATLAAGGDCTVEVRFTPAASGTAAGVVSIISDAGNVTASLAGTGIAPSLSVSPGDLAFGSQRVGSSSDTRWVTVDNPGSDTLLIRNIAVTGTGFGRDGGSCVTTLAAGTQCTIGLRFLPSSSGTTTGALQIDSDAGAQTVNLAGTGVAPSLSVSPGMVAFGSQRVGQPGSLRTVTVRNPGSDVLALTSIAVTGPGFARDGGSCGSTLAAGGSCTIGLRFAPGVSGAATGSLAIGSDGGAATVSLSGTGTAPALSLSERSLSFGRAGVIRFGEIRVGQTSQPQTITATNTGTAPLAISSIRTTGDFVQTTTCGKTLAINASCTISLRFKPSTPGDRSGETVITSDALTSPDRITLSGRGVGVAVKR